MSDYQKANLVFMDAIQRAASATNTSVKELRDALAGMFALVADSNAKSTAAMAEIIKALPSSKVKNIVDLSPFVEAIKKLETINSNMSSELKAFLEMNYDAIAKIEDTLTKEKKWRMKINRNFDTKLIQDVIIEQVKE